MKIILKATAIVCLPITQYGHLFAQQPPPPLFSPNIIPVSPEAAALAKYINYPVDYSNGLPMIEIPLYEIEDGDITIPISLSYHASGFRVHQAETWLGYGWTLNAEPVITRSVQGSPDENAYLKGISPSERASANFLKYLSEGFYDEEPDEFYYRLSSGSGKFFIKKVYGEPAKVITFPKEPLEILFATNTPLTTINTFSIADNKGLLYHFGENNAHEITNLGKKTSWKGTRIVSRKTGNEVLFEYFNPVNLTIASMPADHITILDSMNQNNFGSYTVNPISTSPPPEFQVPMPAVLIDRLGTLSYHTVKRIGLTNNGELEALGYSGSSGTALDYMVATRHIKKISFSGGTVEFEQYNGLLTRILISDRHGQPVRSIEFIQSRNNTTNRVKLSEIRFKDRNQTQVERYVFNYNGDLPVGWSSRSIDYWGFYNGAPNTGTLLPPIQVSGIEFGDPLGQVNFTIGDANRNSDEAMMKIGVLNKITYPTGGSSLFEYEAHRYNDEFGMSKIAGGLRIRSITEEDGNGGIMYRHFRYGLNENGLGNLFQKISSENFFSVSRDAYFQPYYIGVNSTYYEWKQANGTIWLRRRVFSSNSLIDLMYQAGSVVRYSTVTEYRSSDPWNEDVIGKTIHRYSIPAGPTIQKVPGESVVFDYKNQWTFGHDTLVQVFKSQGSGASSTYSPLSSTSKEYTQKDFSVDKITVAKTYRRVNVYPNENPAWGYHSNVMRYQYDIVPGYNKVSQVIDTLIEGTSRHIKKHELFYDDNLNVFKESIGGSNGEKETTLRTYPQDYANLSGPIYEMKSNHLVSYPIEEVKLKEVGSIQTIVSGNIKTYKTGGKGLVDQVLTLETSNPIALTSFKFSNRALGQLPPANTPTTYSPDTRYKPRLQYKNHDTKGNPLEVTETSGPPTSYLWSYNGQYPIAEVKNAAQADIAYGGFESDGNGNWSYVGATAADVTAPTGRRVYNLSGGSLQKTGLTAGRSYLLTYWAKSVSATGISGGTATVMRSRGGWTQYRRIISGVTSVTLSGSVAVDDVRLHPVEAIMNSYTYDPLVGMTSHTDASGNVFQYEYDDFGRLKAVKDLNGHLMEDYRYHYRNQ